jgi:N6-L-threonylcarbamoyladenine synthase
VILALETSCDDTCAAVVDRAGVIHSNVISSQAVHGRFGGVVPELASRHHLENVNLIVDEALARARASLDDVELVAVTQGPGLVGALLVGVATAKALAAARRLDLRPVDHLQGTSRRPSCTRMRPRRAALRLPDRLGRAHAARPGGRLRDPRRPGRHARRRGGGGVRQGRPHARLGYPGGPALSALAREGRSCGVSRSRRRRRARAQLLLRRLEDLPALQDPRSRETEAGRRAADLAASYEHAIVESLIARVRRALEATGLDRLALGGGVAANSRLRERVAALGVAQVHIPPRELCTDNAAMIGSAARWVAPVPFPEYLGLDAYATRSRLAAA